MSAECSKCGSDITYPEGTWPLGECRPCTLEARLREVEAKSEGRRVSRDLYRDRMAKAEARVAELEAALRRADDWCNELLNHEEEPSEAEIRDLRRLITEAL